MLHTLNKNSEKEIHKMATNAHKCDEIGSKITDSTKSIQKLENNNKNNRKLFYHILLKIP